MSTEKLGNYPFADDEKPARVHMEFGRHVQTLLEDPLFAHVDRDELFNYLSAHFVLAESFFLKEDEDRKKGKTNANLFYHHKGHAVYQTSYDTVTTFIALLAQDSQSASYLTVDGITAGIISAADHDSGYVLFAQDDENYAARLPIHVQLGMEASKNILEQIPTPAFLNKRKLKDFVYWGIHSTHFPQREEHIEEARRFSDTLDAKEAKEFDLVRLVVQLGDLGGQVARNDYWENLKNLKKELNCYKEGLGEELIGTDSEMLPKCKIFIETVVVPTVGKSATELFGTGQNIFSLEWEKRATIETAIKIPISNPDIV